MGRKEKTDWSQVILTAVAVIITALIYLAIYYALLYVIKTGGSK